MNKCIFIGRLGADLEMKSSASGNSFATANIAVNENRKVDGEWQTETTWVSLVFFGKSAENAHRVLHKGDLISVDAKYNKRDYTTKEGNKAYSHSFVVNQWSRIVAANPQNTVDEEGDAQDFGNEDIPF